MHFLLEWGLRDNIISLEVLEHSKCSREYPKTLVGKWVKYEECKLQLLSYLKARLGLLVWLNQPDFLWLTVSMGPSHSKPNQSRFDSR